VAKKRTCREDKRRGRKPKGEGAHGKQPKKSDDVEDDVVCIMCGKVFRHSVAGESWIQCRKCKGWCHDDCSAGEGSAGFVCDFCTAD